MPQNLQERVYRRAVIRLNRSTPLYCSGYDSYNNKPYWTTDIGEAWICRNYGDALDFVRWNAGFPVADANFEVVRLKI